MLKILVVDDSELNRAIFGKIVKSLGHQVFYAESGDEALRNMNQVSPDLILLDILMPGKNGYEVAKEIRERNTEWLPIIFISALNEMEDVIEGLQSGGDDYITKPINSDLLSAKIQMFQERIRLLNKVKEQNTVLLQFQHRIQQERQSAVEFVEKIVDRKRMNDSRIQYVMDAAEEFNGDLVAYSETPSGLINVMLADGNGHGLMAALSVMLVLTPFYTLSEKGLTAAELAREINQIVYAFSARDRFVAAIIMTIDYKNGTIQVWNGGCPPVIVQARNGGLTEFHSEHTPLGILPSQQFNDSIQTILFNDEKKIIFIGTDGLFESLTENNTLDEGLKKFMDLLPRFSEEEFVKETKELFSNVLKSDSYVQDDMALIRIDCDLDSCSKTKLQKVNRPVYSLFNHDDNFVNWHMEMRFNKEQLHENNMVTLLLSIVQQIEFNDGEVAGKLFLVLSELMTNALDHGLLRLDSKLKQNAENPNFYMEEKERRLMNMTEQMIIRVRLERMSILGKDSLRITVIDSGQGFDVGNVLQRIQNFDENSSYHGRGLALIRGIANTLQFYGNGNHVEVVLDVNDGLSS